MEKPFALIVEDDRDIVALFRHVLDLAGYQTEIALHGKVAVDFLSRRKPDIVLLDLNLPGVSGVEILSMMRADERLRNIPVVVITAHSHLVESMNIKPQLVLIKPVNIEQMTNLILRICPAEKSMESLPWDVLTGVYNRSFFTARIKYALERAKQLHQNKFAVLTLDLGQSTKLEYLFGREYNDRVLKDAAALLKTLLRPTDTIARSGKGVFSILIEDVGNPDTPILIASRIQSRIRKHLAKLEKEFQMQVNIGIVLCGEEYESVDEVLYAAERALTLAKSDRKKMLQLLRSQSIEATGDIGWTSPAA
jgi:diguanylate cyclase (GGDEF)-like protein